MTAHTGVDLRISRHIGKDRPQPWGTGQRWRLVRDNEHIEKKTWTWAWAGRRAGGPGGRRQVPSPGGRASGENLRGGGNSDGAAVRRKNGKNAARTRKTASRAGRPFAGSR